MKEATKSLGMKARAMAALVVLTISSLISAASSQAAGKPVGPPKTAAVASSPRPVTREGIENFLVKDCWFQWANSEVPITFNGNELVVVVLDGEKSFSEAYHEFSRTVPLSQVRVNGILGYAVRSPYEIELECVKAGCIASRFERKAAYRFSESVEKGKDHRIQLQCRSPRAVPWWSSLVTSLGGNQDDPLNPPVDAQKKR